ncbi:MAG: hypothetical protein KF911_10020 [Pseudomonadales bacterium]|nr:hypothetical protein [Pseudomonadales bacterium]
MNDSYDFSLIRVRLPGRSWQPYRTALFERLADVLQPTGAALWGAFSGLFGIASNELILMTHGPDPRRLAEGSLGEARITEQYRLTPTVRPSTPPPALIRPGVYVFRFFDTESRHIDAIAALSQEAWTTFENTSAYQSEPLGLFAPADRSGSEARMLLLTWYDGFGSWEKSRTPAPAARANFARRHELTSGTVAFATALIGAA